MAPAVTSGGEVIIICIDNTTRILDYYRAQLEAIKSYATYQIQSHPRTVVGLLKMSHTPYDDSIGYLDRTLHFALKPTRDLHKIINTLPHIKCGGELDFVQAIINCVLLFPCRLQKMQKRMVMFAGGDINMSLHSIKDYANPLKGENIAVDVVNFTLGDIHGFRNQMLEAFVDAVNNNHNSRIIHIQHGSSLSNLLSSFMAKEKNHQSNHSKTSGMTKKAKENETVDVKRESEPSCKGATNHVNVEYGKYAPSLTLLNKFEALSISTEWKG